MKSFLFFDNASTTRCCDAATQLIQRFANEEYGNPSSAHAYGQQAAKAIRDARVFFANTFKVDPPQVIFTGSGSEADNLAIYGVAMEALIRAKGKGAPRVRVITSSIEHPAVRKTVQSLTALGIETVFLPVDSQGQVREEDLRAALTPNTCLVSIMQVNNIVGAILPVEKLAALAKEKVPGAIFHTDAVQAFGKVKHPSAPSPIDLVSISGHKVHGPKGVGALIVLNKTLLKAGLRPLIWGGEQEGGFRSGTQNAGLIAGFHAAAKELLGRQTESVAHARALRSRLLERLIEKKIITSDGKGPMQLNSPQNGLPHIVNLSAPGFPSGAFAKLLEERACLVSTGSACSSGKSEPDAVLAAMGLPQASQVSAIRVSFCEDNSVEDVDRLANALDESLKLMATLLGGRPA